MVRDQLREAVDLAIAHLQHAAGVLQHRARLQPPERDDLRDFVAAIFALDVGDDLVAMRFAEVDVEVRHRHALGIEEALEQQVERDRVEIGDRQRPGDDRARARSAARADRNVVGLRPFDEVGDDQEVAGKTHADDDVELIVEPLEIGLRSSAARPFSRVSRPGAASRRSCSSSSSPSRGRIGLRLAPQRRSAGRSPRCWRALRADRRTARPSPCRPSARRPARSVTRSALST